MTACIGGLPLRSYSKLVPHDSFMGRYLRYMDTQETAHAFDWWCGLWCLSAACGRSTYVARPRAPVYLNMFVVLVGESGVARKTTSVATATRVVRSVLAVRNDIGLIDAKVTPEKLDLLLHMRSAEFGTAQLCISIPELAVFLGTERYIAHMPTLLTDLYDCPSVRSGGGTIARGAVLQQDVWLHFLSASTPIWLLKTVNPNVVEGGFTSRCYFILSNEPKRKVAWPEEPDHDLFQDLCDDLRIIAAESSVRGPIPVSANARAAIERWYADREPSTDPFKQSFEAREDAHVLRIAALLSINDGSWNTKRSHIHVAIRLTNELKEQSGNIFTHSQTRTKMSMGFDTLRTLLVNTGMDPIPRHALFRRCRHHINNDEFNTLIETLQELGAIQRFYVESERGRPTDFIRGTTLLMAKGLGAAVLDKFS